MTPFLRPSLDGVLVVATDGLFKYGPCEKIAHAVRDSGVEEAAQGLTRLVRLRSGEYQDDVAVVIVRSARP